MGYFGGTSSFIQNYTGSAYANTPYASWIGQIGSGAPNLTPHLPAENEKILTFKSGGYFSVYNGIVGRRGAYYYRGRIVFGDGTQLSFGTGFVFYFSSNDLSTLIDNYSSLQHDSYLLGTPIPVIRTSQKEFFYNPESMVDGAKYSINLVAPLLIGGRSLTDAGLYYTPSPNVFTVGSSPIELTGAQWKRLLSYIEDGVIKYDGYSLDTPDPYNPGVGGGAGASNTGGGGGSFTITGAEPIAEPDLPAIEAVDTGFVSLYSPTLTQLKSLASYIWNDLRDLNQVINALKNIVANPMDLIIGLSLVPNTGLSTGGTQSIKIGFVDTGIALTTLNSQYFTVDCGSLHIDYASGKTFLDYAPYSKFSVYLPYIGIKQLDANDIIDKTLQIKYHCDALSGSCVAFIIIDGGVYYEYTGAIATPVPVNAQNWTTLLTSTIQQATSGIVSAVASGSALPLAESAASIAGSVLTTKPDITRGSAVSGSPAIMAVQKPYLIREAPNISSATGFNLIGGYPSNILETLGNLSGFTQVQTIHLHCAGATQAEKTEIETLLKEGVQL